VDEAQFTLMTQSKPTLVNLKKFSGEFLKSKGQSEEVVEDYLKSLDQLGEDQVPEGVELIKDVDEFRLACEPAPHSIPVEEYADLFPKL